MPVMLAEAPMGVQLPPRVAPGQQAEVEQGGVHVQSCGQAGDHRQHGGNIGDVVDEGGEQHRCPDNDGIDDEEAAAAHLGQQVGHCVHHAHVGDAADDQNRPNSKADGFKVDGL